MLTLIILFPGIMSVRKRLSGRRRRVDPLAPPPDEKQDEDITEEIKYSEKWNEQTAASGSSSHSLRPPELFWHLSVPEEDKHDLHNRSKPSITFNVSGKAEDDGDVHTHSSSEERKKTVEEEKDDGKLKLAGEANPDEGDDEDPVPQDEADFDEHAFDHPATYKPQPCIWIPRDNLGLSAVLLKDLKSMEIDASDEGAVMDDKGIVEVLRCPPDEEWLEGIDR